jgi:Tfp pilus assembly protein PilX
MFHRSSRRHAGNRLLNDESGIILIAVLTLLSALILAGVTAFIMASTNIKVGGNLKTNQTALQVAMAGAEQGRQNLRALNNASLVKTNFTEELTSRRGANGALNGYTSSTDDAPIANSTALVSGYTYNAYLTNDSIDGAANATDTNGIVLITSVATGPNNTKAIVQTTVKLYSLAQNSPAVLYSKNNVLLSGSAVSINGVDAGNCGTGSPLGTVYTKDPATYLDANGHPHLSSSPTHGTMDIDLVALANQLKTGATILTNDVSGATYGSATNYVTVYADATSSPMNGSINMNNVTGYGILIVKGDLAMAGNINWNGIIIVTGNMSSSGGGKAGKNLTGQIFAGSSSLGDTEISGNVDLAYDSCAIKKAFSSQPLLLVNWKQSY